MKILIVGDGASKIHEVAIYEAFKKMGHQAGHFFWHQYFHSEHWIANVWLRFQNKFLFGPRLASLNSDLISVAQKQEPDLIFIYRGTHVYPKTIRRIKNKLPNCLIYGYNNDNPFSSGHPSWLWRNFLRSLPAYDIVFAYRHENLRDFLRMGAKKALLLRSWYLPEFHKFSFLPHPSEKQYECDCVFVGHFEDDGRTACIEILLENKVNVRVFGPYKGLGKSGWDVPVKKSEILQRLLPINYLTGRSYVDAISSTPIALCFLSKLNHDTYTRRCFEIPAIGAALFSEYSDDLATLFVDGEEAVFFRNKNELLEKVVYYLAHPNELDCLRRRGHERVVRDGHDIYTRLSSVVELVQVL